MLAKIFIVFVSFIVFTSAQKCPPLPGATTPTNCTLVPGCNFAENGTLTSLAIQCSNQIDDADCEQLFPCILTPAPPGLSVGCNQQTPTVGTDPSTYPYVRAPSCNSISLQNVALQCAKTCGLCCQSPQYNCEDDVNSPVDCPSNIQKCTDANWTNIMAEYCPKTCGLCANGTCRDLNSGCNSVASLCKNIDWISYMNINCARTCDICTSSGSSNCRDIAPNCAQNSNLCTNSVYMQLMQQQCCATCGRTGISGNTGSISGTCTDTSTSCSSWVTNGFCTSAFYTSDQRRQYCAKSCNLC